MLRRVLACALILALACAGLPFSGGADMPDPALLTETDGIPDLMTFADGTPVASAEDWPRRREELLALYSHYVYGYMPDPGGETLAWSVADAPELGGKLLTVTVTVGENTGELSYLVTLPEGEAPEGGWPYFVEYMPWSYSWGGQTYSGPSQNCLYAASRGYAGVNYDPSQAAADNGMHFGAFYKLYRYDAVRRDDQRGVLLAWAWGVSKLIDALEAGAGAELGIDPSLSLVGGVSRWGKSAAVAGAYDPRIAVTIPACSGLGGIAMFRTDNEGKTYDLTSLGGPAAWVNTSRNEPFSNLRDGEGYWFCGNFTRMRGADWLPVDQHMLCALIAGEGRHLIVVTGITSEGWNNTEGQCLAWLAGKQTWDLLGIGDQTHILIHLDGHAILPSDMELILDYCDVNLLGRDPSAVTGDLSSMEGQLFLEENRDVLDDAFAPYLGD